MSKTELGQDLSSVKANQDYLLKTEDDTIIGILSLEQGVDLNKHIGNLQEFVYTITDLLGVIGEADPNLKIYTTNNVIANGDNYKVALQKFDVGMQVNIDNIAINATDINTINTSIGQPNGIASLDGAGLLPLAQLPNGIFIYKGTWDATTNTPTLIDGTGTSGEVYRVNVAGTQDLGSGSFDYVVGDKVVYNGTIWEKWDTTDEVVSVFGRSGDVIAESGDYTAAQVGLGNVTNDAQLKRAAADIDSFTEKVSPSGTDYILIEDSADSLNKKKIQIANLPTGGVGTAVYGRYSSDAGLGITATVTPYIYEDILEEISPIYNNTTGQITIPENGRYIIHACAFPNTTTTRNYQAFLRVDGVEVKVLQHRGTTDSFEISDTLNLTTGQLVDVCFVSLSGGVFTSTTGNRNVMTIAKVI